MKNKYLYVTLIFIVICLRAFAQNLPDEMHFSSDGRRLITGNLPYTGFYELYTIHDVRLDFSDNDYWDDLEDNYNDGDNEDILGTITINGIVYDSVGVRFKGNSSYTSANNDKKSFNISLDAFIPDQDIEGYKTLNLHNCMGDPSYMAEVLFEHQISKHVPAPKGNFVHLFINGMDWGLYANVQQVNRKFIKEWFLDNEGALWRAETPPGSNSISHSGDSLHSLYYIGNDTNTYRNNYHLKASHITHPYLKLMTLTRVMDTVVQSRKESILGNYLDIDRALWFLASENAFGDDDSYVVEARSDYSFYYEPETGRIAPLEIDGNGALDYDYHNQSIFLNANNPNYALLHELLNHPELRQRYLAHMRTLVNDEMNIANVNSIVNTIFNIIKPIVQNDPVSNYSYSDFIDEVDNVKDFFADRRDYILNNSEIDEDLPTINNTTFYTGTVAWQRPNANQSVYVTAYAESPDDVDKVTLYYATGLVGKFSKKTMYDDGQHHDQQANDDIYGATISGYDGGTWVRFYTEVTSDNSDKTVAFDPPGAEHDIYTYLVLPELASDTSIVINELMAKNVSTVADSAGEFGDWIELYNNSNQQKNISGFYLTDNSLNLIKWTVPQGTIIRAHGYLILWADENEDAGMYHTNFKFSGDGEQLILLNTNNEIVDEVAFGPQSDDLSYARVPNGSGSFIIQPPTFSINNNPNPQAVITSVSTTSGCAPLAVSFSNNSTNTLTYEWNFGDGSTSAFPSPVHTYISPGNYTVTLTAINTGFSDVDTMSGTITVIGGIPFNFPSDTVTTADVVYELTADSGYSAYQWSTNEITPSISVGANGTYCVVVTSPNNCTESDCIYVIVDVLGMEELNPGKILYTNPVDNFFILETDNDRNLKIEIVNLVGQTIYKNEFTRKTTIVTHTWAEGIYFVRLGNVSKALVVQH